jgi:hypothetical protein
MEKTLTRRQGFNLFPQVIAEPLFSVKFLSGFVLKACPKTSSRVFHISTLKDGLKLRQQNGRLFLRNLFGFGDGHQRLCRIVASAAACDMLDVEFDFVQKRGQCPFVIG